MNVKSLLLAVLCLFSIAPVFSQKLPENYSIKGIVLDSVTQKPLDFITVGLKDMANVPVKNLLTKADGKFVIDKIKPGKYTLNVISVGFITKTRIVNLTDTLTDLGSILLSAQNNQLKEITISADKPLIKQDIDKLTYDIQADPENKVTNVLEMMRKVPLLSVDADDNVQLKGESNYKILINGKPSSMMERSAKDVLKSMPASSIQSIEVITTPSSKYDSEGVAGIINIITNKKIDNGYNGSLNTSYRFPVGGPGIGGNITLKQGKFGMSANGSYGYYTSPQVTSVLSRQTYGTSATNLAQNNFRNFDGQYTYISSELSFEIDTLNLISGQYNINKNSFNNTSLSSSVLDNPERIIQSYNLTNLGKSLGTGTDFALNYQHGFKANKNKLLTFSYRYYEYKNDNINNILLSDAADYKQQNIGASNEKTIQLDYVHPFKKITIEAGLKGIQRNNNSDFQYQTLNENRDIFETDLSRTNKYNNRQTILGAYNTYQYTLKEWGFKAGMRIEETIIHADFITSASKVDQNYFNIIPSVSINRKFKNMSSANFGYTQRIQRPGIYNLNPFVDRSNPNFESTGNPNLKAVLNNSFQLNYTTFKKGNINIGLTYQFSNNTIQNTSIVNSSTGVVSTTYANAGKNRSAGTNLSVNYPLTPKLSLNLSGNMGYILIRGFVNGIAAKNNGIWGNVNGGASYKFDNGMRINANAGYNSPFIYLQGTYSSNQYSSFSLSKDLLKDKLALSASFNNPFNKFRYNRNVTNGDDFYQLSSSQNYFRSYTATLNYRFGKLKDAIKKNKRGISNDDVSGGNQ